MDLVQTSDVHPFSATVDFARRDFGRVAVSSSFTPTQKRVLSLPERQKDIP